MNDHFYGWERATVPALNHDYPGIETPRDLYDALLDLWCADTCATPGNPTLGQCSITAFLVQDIFGGRVYGVPLKDGGFHCFNVVDGHAFDLTSQQFGDAKLKYDGCPEQFREVHFAKEEKQARYERLKAMLKEKTSAQ